MAAKQSATLSQQEFLRDAIHELGLTHAGLAQRISVPEKTLDKWLAPAETNDFRNIPDVVWACIREILEWEKVGFDIPPMGGI